MKLQALSCSKHFFSTCEHALQPITPFPPYSSGSSIAAPSAAATIDQNDDDGRAAVVAETNAKGQRQGQRCS